MLKQTSCLWWMCTSTWALSTRVMPTTTAQMRQLTMPGPALLRFGLAGCVPQRASLLHRWLHTTSSTAGSLRAFLCGCWCQRWSHHQRWQPGRWIGRCCQWPWHPESHDCSAGPDLPDCCRWSQCWRLTSWMDCSWSYQLSDVLWLHNRNVPWQWCVLPICHHLACGQGLPSGFAWIFRQFVQADEGDLQHGCRSQATWFSQTGGFAVCGEGRICQATSIDSSVSEMWSGSKLCTFFSTSLQGLQLCDCFPCFMGMLSHLFLKISWSRLTMINLFETNRF